MQYACSFAQLDPSQQTVCAPVLCHSLSKQLPSCLDITVLPCSLPMFSFLWHSDSSLPEHTASPGVVHGPVVEPSYKDKSRVQQWL